METECCAKGACQIPQICCCRTASSFSPKRFVGLSLGIKLATSYLVFQAKNLVYFRGRGLIKFVSDLSCGAVPLNAYVIFEWPLIVFEGIKISNRIMQAFAMLKKNPVHSYNQYSFHVVRSYFPIYPFSKSMPWCCWFTPNSAKVILQDRARTGCPWIELQHEIMLKIYYSG
jgi:hypothetical protein